MEELLHFLRRMLPGCAVAVLLWGAVFPLRRSRLNRLDLRSGPGREWLLALFAAFCGGMAVLTLTPPGFDLLKALAGQWSEPFFRPGTMNLELFRTLRYSRLVLLGNFIMFMPFGFLPAVLWRGDRWYRALTISVGITACIECWQLHIGRSFDVDDLLFNAIGTMLGWGLWLLLKKPTLTCEER